jgi:glycosyltransferase involved in cell wall biosynthesis
MSKPLFSIVLITKNEGNTLPKCMESLSEFISRGGEIIIGDTGSTDNTIEVAKSYGCIVHSINVMIDIDANTCKAINERFIEDEALVMPDNGTKIFDFSTARNLALSYASNEFIISLDGDEAYTKFDIDYINDKIQTGSTQLQYQFVYAHNEDGTPSMQFKQCKAFDRRLMEWKGIIHEYVGYKDGFEGQGYCSDIEETFIKLEHWQEPNKEHRGKYIIGLAYDCFMHPSNDRHSHYLARELYYTNRPKSAIKEFKRHISFNAWNSERAQSMIYVGECYGFLGDRENQINYYSLAFHTDSHRREALIKMAQYYLWSNNYLGAICYAKASLEIKWQDYYANHISHYTDEPHRILYLAYGYSGNIEEARKHIDICLSYHPNHPDYLAHYRYYFDLPKISVLIPHIIATKEEGLKRCVNSIRNQSYPQEKIEIKILLGEDSVPNKVAKGVSETDGGLIVFASNDIEFDKDDFMKAYLDHKQTTSELIVFNTGIKNEDEYICECFMISRNALSYLSNGQIFDTRFQHYGCNDYLWHQMNMVAESYICIRTKTKYFNIPKTDIHLNGICQKEAEYIEQDRELLKALIENKQLTETI